MIARLRRGKISQDQLAIRAGTSQSYLSRLEAGTVQPTIEQANRVLLCLGYRLKIDIEPLARRSDLAGLPDQLLLSFEERIQGAAAMHNTMLELRGPVSA